jgi:Domain of unknown function (DUF5659)
VGGNGKAASSTMAPLLTHLPMTYSHYETSNVYLAAFLLCQGATLLGFERVSPRRNIFRFASDETLHGLLRLYWKNVPFTIVPTELFDSLRSLKSRTRLRPAAMRGRSAGTAMPRPAMGGGAGELGQPSSPAAPC